MNTRRPIIISKNLQSIGKSTNSCVNGTTKLAPNTKNEKHAPHSRDLPIERSKEAIRKPSFQVGNNVLIAKEDLPFSKSKKQNQSNESFTIKNIPIFNPLSNSLTDKTGELRGGNLYQREVLRVSGRTCHLPAIYRFDG